jgi:hypothetical protein
MKKILSLILTVHFAIAAAAFDSPDPDPKIVAEPAVQILGEAEGGVLLRKVDLTIARLQGAPEQLGRQHGRLLGSRVRRTVLRTLYATTLPATVMQKRWFFDSITDAWRRTSPHISRAHIFEMDALARAAEMHPGEIRLAQTFPELFHCSGFALAGPATADGMLYHGRILDYMTNVGLQDNAVVFAITPENGFRWVNVGFAGFIGTVTAMNEKKLVIGEMGGQMPGDWDGKPMSFLLREIMEKCETVEQAVDFLKNTPRTCEFYYVISSGANHDAVGIRATSKELEVIRLGESHPRLNNPAPHTVLMSAGERYDHLAERVHQKHGQFDVISALKLMTRPVAMESCLHAVLFRPDTLELWVSYASTAGAPATTQPYIHLTWDELFNLP